MYTMDFTSLSVMLTKSISVRIATWHTFQKHVTNCNKYRKMTL
uniref:Uncharacterized protein n=1 Tax=Setaria italica TaxID=4555 RepID=K3ZG85_SETIT